MPHLGGVHPAPNMHWDYQDQLCRTDLGGSGSGGTAYYVYDAAGQRVQSGEGIWCGRHRRHFGSRDFESVECPNRPRGQIKPGVERFGCGDHCHQVGTVVLVMNSRPVKVALVTNQFINGVGISRA